MNYKNKTTMKKLICLLLLGVTLTASAQKSGNPYKRYTQSLPFAMPEVSAPIFSDRQVNLKDLPSTPKLLPRPSIN